MDSAIRADVEMCRLCLKKKSCMKNIFEHTLKNSDLNTIECVYWMFGVEIDYDDRKSKYICNKCLNLIELIAKYRKIFQENQLKWVHNETNYQNSTPPDLTLDLIEDYNTVHTDDMPNLKSIYEIDPTYSLNRERLSRGSPLKYVRVPVQNLTYLQPFVKLSPLNKIKEYEQITNITYKKVYKSNITKTRDNYLDLKYAPKTDNVTMKGKKLKAIKNYYYQLNTKSIGELIQERLHYNKTEEVLSHYPYINKTYEEDNNLFTTTEKNVLVCEHCSEYFTTSFFLSNHLKYKHRGIIDETSLFGVKNKENIPNDHFETSDADDEDEEKKVYKRRGRKPQRKRRKITTQKIKSSKEESTNSSSKTKFIKSEITEDEKISNIKINLNELFDAEEEINKSADETSLNNIDNTKGMEGEWTKSSSMLKKPEITVGDQTSNEELISSIQSNFSKLFTAEEKINKTQFLNGIDNAEVFGEENNATKTIKKKRCFRRRLRKKVGSNKPNPKNKSTLQKITTNNSNTVKKTPPTTKETHVDLNDFLNDMMDNMKHQDKTSVKVENKTFSSVQQSNKMPNNPNIKKRKNSEETHLKQSEIKNDESHDESNTIKSKLRKRRKQNLKYTQTIFPPSKSNPKKGTENTALIEILNEVFDEMNDDIQDKTEIKSESAISNLQMSEGTNVKKNKKNYYNYDYVSDEFLVKIKDKIDLEMKTHWTHLNSDRKKEIKKIDDLIEKLKEPKNLDKTIKSEDKKETLDEKNVKTSKEKLELSIKCNEIMPNLTPVIPDDVKEIKEPNKISNVINLKKLGVKPTKTKKKHRYFVGGRKRKKSNIKLKLNPVRLKLDDKLLNGIKQEEEIKDNDLLIDIKYILENNEMMKEETTTENNIMDEINLSQPSTSLSMVHDSTTNCSPVINKEYSKMLNDALNFSSHASTKTETDFKNIIYGGVNWDVKLNGFVTKKTPEKLSPLEESKMFVQPNSRKRPWEKMSHVKGDAQKNSLSPKIYCNVILHNNKVIDVRSEYNINYLRTNMQPVVFLQRFEESPVKNSKETIGEAIEQFLNLSL